MGVAAVIVLLTKIASDFASLNAAALSSLTVKNNVMLFGKFIFLVAAKVDEDNFFFGSIELRAFLAGTILTLIRRQH